MSYQQRLTNYLFPRLRGCDRMKEAVGNCAKFLGPGVDVSGAVMGSMLVCAVLASLAFGVLVAHGICVGMFRVFRGQSVAAAQKRAAEPKAMQVAVEG